MRLISGRIARKSEALPKRKNIRRMVNPPNNNGEKPSRMTGESTIVAIVTEAILLTMSTTIIPSSTQSGPILSLVITQSQLVTPRPIMSSTFRLYVHGFTMPMDGCEHPYGMPTSVMMSLHNSASTFVGPTVTMYSLLQGSGSAVNNPGRTTQPLGT